jgi:hypothetical protein
MVEGNDGIRWGGEAGSRLEAYGQWQHLMGNIAVGEAAPMEGR